MLIAGRVLVTRSSLRGTNISGEIIPRLIDEIPIIAVAATQAQGITEISGARELRVKESDRLAAISAELGKMGAKIKELDDGMISEEDFEARGLRHPGRPSKKKQKTIGKKCFDR